MDHPASNAIKIVNARGQEYAGSPACRDCHKAIYDSFRTTLHHLASDTASREYIKGSFAKNENTFWFDSLRKIVMEQRADGLYQVAYEDGKETRAERFDIVIGSGKKGQTSLYWKNRELYQLPITYFANGHTWVNSPGYPMDKLFFDRPIEGRCMECHVTFAKEQFNAEYNPQQIIYGIECERCHGPAAKHVEFQLQNPEEKKGQFIVNPRSLPRQQKMDVCAVCHSGVMERLSPAFSFLPGDTLSKYFIRNFSRIDSFNLDVHANQYGLLTASKCYWLTETMNCATCHDLHQKEKGNLVLFAQKCMGCHAESNHNFCTLRPSVGFSMEANCVNCHMPEGESKNITAMSNGQPAAAPELVRSHHIAIYPGLAEKVLRGN
jgi:hypothetical protein